MAAIKSLQQLTEEETALDQHVCHSICDITLVCSTRNTHCGITPTGFAPPHVK